MSNPMNYGPQPPDGNPMDAGPAETAAPAATTAGTAAGAAGNAIGAAAIFGEDSDSEGPDYSGVQLQVQHQQVRGPHQADSADRRRRPQGRRARG